MGQDLTVDIFAAGEKVKVTGTSKGKGFAGGHETLEFPGSVQLARRGEGPSQRRAPSATIPNHGKVIKNKKMAGQMGNRRVTVLNVEVMDERPEENILLIKGTGPRAHQRPGADPQVQVGDHTMAVVNVYDQTRKEIGTLELAPEVFEVPVRPELLHLAVRAYLAEGRAGTHKAKERAK